MAESKTNYDPKQDQIVISFTDELKKQIPNYLKDIALYGSRARDNNKKYSDYDFVVLLNEKNEETAEIIYDLTLRKYDMLSRSCNFQKELVKSNGSVKTGFLRAEPLKPPVGSLPKTPHLRKVSYDIGYGILDKYEQLASCLILNEEEWDIQQKFPIGKNILKDGIWML